jgi:hypothetical protein
MCDKNEAHRVLRPFMWEGCMGGRLMGIQRDNTWRHGVARYT